jgi:hypothetical protein
MDINSFIPHFALLAANPEQLRLKIGIHKFRVAVPLFVCWHTERQIVWEQSIV